MARRSVVDRLLEVAGEQRGFLTVSDAASVGVPAVALRKLAAAGRLDHRGWGLYRLPTFPVTAADEYAEAVLWANGRGIISHESTLALMDLADVNPRRVHITVPPPYRPRRQGADRYVVTTRRVAPEDLTEHDGIPTVTARRAIADEIAAGLDDRLIQQAIDTSRRRESISALEEARLRVALEDRRARSSSVG